MNFYRKIFSVVSLILIVTLLLGGCAAKKITMEPRKIKAGDFKDAPPDGPVTAIDSNLSPEILFNRGLDHYTSGQKAIALSYFLAVVERHPAYKRFTHAAYNSALIYHKWSKYKKALAMYRLVESTSNYKDDLHDSRFQMLDVLHKLKEWQQMGELIAVINKAGGLDPDDEVEIATRTGVVAFEKGQLEDAQLFFSDAYERFLLGIGKDEVYDSYFGAMACYYLAMIERNHFHGVKLTGDATPKMMEELMEKKARRLLGAQEWFLKSMRCNDVYWATASGFRLGLMYEEFYHAFIGAPPPSGLTPEEEEGYKCVLSNKVMVLIKKAIRVYGRTIEISERLRAGNDWIEQTKRHIQELEALYLKDSKKCRDYKVKPES